MAGRIRQPLLPRFAFLVRIAFRISIAVGAVLAALAIGAIGYHYTEGLAWIDAVLSAAMILTGMGPVYPLQTNAGKIFATIYALFSGVFFLSTVAILYAPILHRFLHRFHLEFYSDADTHASKGPGRQQDDD